MRTTNSERLYMIKTISLFFSILLINLSLLASTSTAQTSDNIYGTEGINHIGLAVNKLQETTLFFTETLGWELAGGDPDYPAAFVTDGNLFLTLWQVEEPETATPFHRRKNIGLHHLAITVESLEKLNALHNKLKDMANINIEFSPEFLGSGPTTHMMINEPSGIRLEFIVPGNRIKK